ncbi:N-acetylmuramoyl-L-alanine amidase [Chloroflexales bacterium ZM16-3]|nr:N-acetylmuramoyl-L-alanine amidase [Chloroflexales bacterium ZM16-3]
MSRSAALPHALALVLVAALLSVAAPVRAQQPPQARAESWQISDVTDWEAGASSGLLITNNAGGELRLAEDQVSGAFLSAPFATAFPFNAAGAVWHADLILGTGVRLELRARATPPSTEGNPDDGWGAWQPMESGDARSQADDGALATADVLAFPADSAYLQLRASLTSQVARASAVLSQVTVSYLQTAQATPILAAGLPRRPILSGKETLTQRPVLIGRSDWSGAVEAAQPARRDPQGVIIHQIAADPTSSSLDLMRALLAYQTGVLGWDDLAYHYVIDAEGNLYEGRLGGPTSDVGRLSGGDVAIHIALIAPEGGAPSTEAQGTLIGLLAWLGQAYAIAPAGQHMVLVGSARAQRPNIAAHSEADPAAADPAKATLDLLPQIRSLADQSTVRARWYFAEGNVADYSERLSFFNPTGTQADAKVTLILGGESPLTRIVGVPAGARSDMILNDVITDTSSLPAIVESSAPILAERSMNLTTDVDGGPGIDRLSRIWYFAEGSTEDTNRTYLILFNPQAAAVPVTITYMREDGTQFEQKVQVNGRDRLVVAVNDVLPNASFGARVIAAQPIAVERTMRFGLRETGLHTGRGIDTLSRRWLFAEGTTQNGFQMRLLVLNPNDQPANTEAVFMGPDGTSDVRRYAIPPRTQLVINVNDVVPNLGVSTEVTSDRPVAVERAMTFNDGAAGSVGAGALAPGYRWAFVDGRTRDASYYLCVSNPNPAPATVTVDFVFSDGATAQQQFRVPAESRYTLAVHELYPDEPSVAAVVRGTQPIIAERSIYPGGGTRGGATTLGIPLP